MLVAVAHAVDRRRRVWKDTVPYIASVCVVPRGRLGIGGRAKRRGAC